MTFVMSFTGIWWVIRLVFVVLVPEERRVNCGVPSQPVPVFYCPHHTPASVTFFSLGFCSPLVLPPWRAHSSFVPWFLLPLPVLFFLCFSSLHLSLQVFFSFRVLPEYPVPRVLHRGRWNGQSKERQFWCQIPDDMGFSWQSEVILRLVQHQHLWDVEYSMQIGCSEIQEPDYKRSSPTVWQQAF